MGFEDLADDDHLRPLTEPTLVADMLDLCRPSSASCLCDRPRRNASG